ncbi:MAG: M6 family metalloprotease domain-containing protein [Candidatus Poribacteria bacterium]|nr:M6 family metalloprotease domain-containing protein [Candidatus Poribacteria bacterium]
MKQPRPKQFKSESWTYRLGLAVHHANSVFLSIPLYLVFNAFCHAAPPNPYLFFDKDPATGEFRSKRPESSREFQRALEGCCFVRTQVLPQPDGVEYILGIKVDFSDQPGSRSGAEINGYLFGEEEVSLKTYYYEVSYGQMDVQPGPAGGVIPKGDGWVRAPKPMAYYGEGRISEAQCRELTREACIAVDPIVDFSQYDRDKDGVVDHIIIIHAGDDEASTLKPRDIWSILVRGVNTVLDGVRIESASIVAEEPSFAKPHLGIYFHEFFHDFGAPDVYGTPFTDPNDHKWGLMGFSGPYQGDLVNGIGDGLKPSHIIGYLKWDFDARPETGRHGWIQPIDVVETATQLSVPSFELPPSHNVLFKIDIPGKVDALGNSSEFFLIENRNRESGAMFDTHLPESGILIWHIDETVFRPSTAHFDAAGQIWLEDPNDPKHRGVNPDNPDQIDIRFVTDGAAYSANDNQISFTPASRPNTNANDGSPTGISITNIGAEGSLIPLLVSFGDTYEPNDNPEIAHPIELDQRYESFLFNADDRRDYYRLDAVIGDAIIITLTDVPHDVEFKLSLLDGSGRKIVDGVTTELTNQHIVFRPVKSEALFILVESRAGFNALDSYHLTVREGKIESNELKVSRVRVYPNPLPLGETRITFDFAIPDFQLVDEIELDVLTTSGDVVHSDLIRDVIGAGRFVWDLESNQNRSIATGVYLYVLSVSRNKQYVRELGKMAVIR